jgi:hypothetical protein
MPRDPFIGFCDLLESFAESGEAFFSPFEGMAEKKGAPVLLEMLACPYVLGWRVLHRPVQIALPPRYQF